MVSSSSGFETFDVPGYHTLPAGINDQGIIVGTAADVDTFEGRGFARDTGGAITLLDYPRADSTQLLDVNNHGVIVGSWEDHDGNLHGLMISTVPEPASLIMLGSSLIPTWFIVRRRRDRRAV